MTHRTGRFAEVADLADAVLDGVATRDQIARLESLLEADPGARAFYLDYAALGADLAWERVRADRRSPASASPASQRFDSRATTRRGIAWPAIYSLAAALLIAAAGLAIWLGVFTRPSGPDRGPSEHPIATLTFSESPVVGESPINSGDSIGPQTIRTDAGETELLLTSGTQVVVSGPGELRLDTPMLVTMNRGKAMFTCPHDAVGFAVALPGGVRVVDLGTAFEVEVADDDRWMVRVTEGIVELHTADGVARRIAAGSTGTLRGDGRGVAVAAITEPMPLVAADFGEGARPLELMQIGVGAADYSGGSARFAGSGARFYLATRHTGYSAVPFVFEATVTLTSRGVDPSGTAFIGIGPVEPTGPFATPGEPTVYAEIAPASFAAGFVRFHHNAATTGPMGQRNGRWGDGSTHHVRLKWDPATGTATFEVDQNYTGDFAADFTHTFDLADQPLDPAASRLFFGAGNGTSWDDVSMKVGSATVHPTNQ